VADKWPNSRCGLDLRDGVTRKTQSSGTGNAEFIGKEKTPDCAGVFQFECGEI
jgi:hypothetical protein